MRKKTSRQGRRWDFGGGKLEAVDEEKVKLTAGGEVGVFAGSEGRVSQEWIQGSMGVLEGISQWPACFYRWTSAAVALKAGADEYRHWPVAAKQPYWAWRRNTTERLARGRG